MIALALAASAGVAAAAEADGRLISSEPCPAWTSTYDAFVARQIEDYRDEARLGAAAGVRMRPPDDLAKALPTRSEFVAAQATNDCAKVFYGSDGLKVAAYVWRPKSATKARRPVIVMLRGGNRDFGKFGPNAQLRMNSYLAAGFIVVGVQYRGVDGGEGLEEFGGVDVHDVVNAITLARSLPDADARNVFLQGGSRGGMMAYLAIRDGAEVNAVVALNALADLILELKRRPEVAEQVWSKLIPGYAGGRDEVLRARSGVEIAKTANLPPVLLLHGTADWRADPENSIAVARVLQARGRPYELHVFADDSHGLPWSWRERDRLTIAWFKRFMTQ